MVDASGGNEVGNHETNKKRDPSGTKPVDAYKSNKKSSSRKITSPTNKEMPRTPSYGRASPLDSTKDNKVNDKPKTSGKEGSSSERRAASTEKPRGRSREKPRPSSREKPTRKTNGNSPHSKKAASAHARLTDYSSTNDMPGAGVSHMSNLRSQQLLPGGESTPRRTTEEVQTQASSYAVCSSGGYIPPAISEDTLDDMIKAEEKGNDKYRTTIERKDTSPSRGHSHGYGVAAYSQDKSYENDETYGPPSMRQNKRATIHSPVSEMTTQSYDITDGGTEGHTEASSTLYSEMELQPPSQTANSRRDMRSVSSETTERFLGGLGEDGIWSDEDFFANKQKFAFVCIGVSSMQLMVLLTQMILCGVASVDVNPMIGPFPDAFSEWGGKNAYLMLNGKEYWRIISPVLLHVGVLHLLINVFCQLETCAFFEREWGSSTWLLLYILSGIGCVATSSVTNPDLIGVCSSGALMGLFGAKLAQILSWTIFDINTSTFYESIRLDQLSGLLCSTAVISTLTFFTYIEWSGHVGGLTTGFLAGMLVFCRPIKSTCARVLWGSTGLIGLLLGGSLLGYMLWYEINPDEELADACGYFRNLFPEGYDCECLWN